jgi:bifunctional DNase/RNase
MRQRDVEGELHVCELCAQRFLGTSEAIESATRHDPGRADSEVAVEVEKVIISEIHDEQVLIFRETNGERRLPFVLGIFEATTIYRILKRLQYPRPLTHDAWLASVSAMGAEVQSACISELHEAVYLAELRLKRGPEVLKVDLRPSDALAVVLKAGAPFLVRESVLAGRPQQ